MSPLYFVSICKHILLRLWILPSAINYVRKFYTHFNILCSLGQLCRRKTLETQRRWTPLYNKNWRKPKDKVKIGLMFTLERRDFLKRKYKLNRHTLFTLKRDKFLSITVSEWIGIFTLWWNLGLRRKPQIAFNTLLMNIVLLKVMFHFYH